MTETGNSEKKFFLQVEVSVPLERLSEESQLVSPRLQKSPWFLCETVVTTRRKPVEWWNGASLYLRSNVFSSGSRWSLTFESFERLANAGLEPCPFRGESEIRTVT